MASIWARRTSSGGGAAGRRSPTSRSHKERLEHGKLNSDVRSAQGGAVRAGELGRVLSETLAETLARLGGHGPGSLRADMAASVVRGLPDRAGRDGRRPLPG